MRLNVEIPVAVNAELTRYARKAGRTVSDVVREVVSRWTAEQRRDEAVQRSLGEVPPGEAKTLEE